MSKPFFEEFPSLQLNTDIRDLMGQTEVERVSATKRRDFLRVYLKSTRLIQKADIWTTEQEIKKQLFPQANLTVKIYEKFELSSQYNPEKLMDIYHRQSHEFELQGGYAYRSEVTGILKGLGFSDEDLSKQMSELSGGQKTRVSLGKLLVTKPDVLLLDEPTNHLDMESIRWLENFLRAYKGAVVIVAHDRYFLDRVVTKVVEIFQHKAYVYQGNYSDFAKKKSKSS